MYKYIYIYIFIQYISLHLAPLALTELEGMGQWALWLEVQYTYLLLLKNPVLRSSLTISIRSTLYGQGLGWGGGHSVRGLWCRDVDTGKMLRWENRFIVRRSWRHLGKTLNDHRGEGEKRPYKCLHSTICLYPPMDQHLLSLKDTVSPDIGLNFSV
jgi:hypothetical protein